MESYQLYIDIRVIKYYAEKCSESTSLQVQQQDLGDERQLSTEGTVIDYFNDY